MDVTEEKRKQRELRKSTSLLKRPIFTTKILFKSLYEDFLNALLFVRNNRNIFLRTIVGILVILGIWCLPGQHQDFVTPLQENLTLALWWIGLGVLSSVGLGTGLHTFLLYLGPFIAQVTLAATECKTTEFARYGPERFLCPSEELANSNATAPHLADILPLVWIEAFLWGAGTAIGELPPYFVARAAKRTGKKLEEIEGDNDSDDEDEKSKPPGLFSKITSYVDVFLNKYFVKQGTITKFVMIMLFASIPNPLFDLAGLTCGYHLVPFLLFFLPTLIGKGVLKVTVQAIFVITVFKKDTLQLLFGTIEKWAPFIKGTLHSKFDEVRKQFHRMPGEGDHSSPQKPGFALIWDVLLASMIIYFIISLIDYKVQEYLLKQHTQSIHKYKSPDAKKYD